MRKLSRWRSFNADPAAVQRRTDARTAAMLAGPAPDYPQQLPPGLPLAGEFLAARVNGVLVVITLGTPAHGIGKRGRVDQRCAWVDGKVIADATGMTELCTMLRQMMPKAMPVKAYAGELQWYNAKDEADAAAAN